jgi:hypothetical protein
MWVNTHIESDGHRLLHSSIGFSHCSARPLCGVYGINAHRAVGETAGLCTMKDFFQPQKKQAEACLCKTPEGFMQPVKRSLVHDRRGHGHGDHVCHPCALRQSLRGACLGGVLSAHQKLFAGWG